MSTWPLSCPSGEGTSDRVSIAPRGGVRAVDREAPRPLRTESRHAGTRARGAYTDARAHHGGRQVAVRVRAG